MGGKTKNEYETNMSLISGNESEIDAKDNKLVVLTLDQIRELFAYRIHFGVENFLNIFRTFYYLSYISPEAENNPFALYID